jgi:hypothetical protein
LILSWFCKSNCILNWYSLMNTATVYPDTSLVSYCRYFSTYCNKYFLCIYIQAVLTFACSGISCSIWINTSREWLVFWQCN